MSTLADSSKIFEYAD